MSTALHHHPHLSEAWNRALLAVAGAAVALSLAWAAITIGREVHPSVPAPPPPSPAPPVQPGS